MIRSHAHAGALQANHENRAQKQVCPRCQIREPQHPSSLCHQCYQTVTTHEKERRAP